MDKKLNKRLEIIKELWNMSAYDPLIKAILLRDRFLDLPADPFYTHETFLEEKMLSIIKIQRSKIQSLEQDRVIANGKGV